MFWRTPSVRLRGLQVAPILGRGEGSHGFGAAATVRNVGAC